MRGQSNVTLYTRDGWRAAGQGVWHQMFDGLVNNFDILYLLMRRDIVIRYRQSLLGVVWVLVPPLVTAGIFAYLSAHRVLPIGDTGLPYLLFALINLSFWHLFAGVLTNAAGSLLGAGPLVTKASFSKDVLVLAAAGQPMVDFGVRLIPVIVAFLWYGVLPPLQALLIPLLLVPVLLMATGLAFLLSVLNLVIRDAGNVLSVALSIGIFLGPVLYPPPTEMPFALVNWINPMAPVLIAVQDLFISGELTRPGLLLGAVIFSLVTFFAGWRIFHLAMPRVAERA